jgi:phosphoglycolate phosphatase
MKGYTHLIWDFNGTILDDVEVGIRSANRLLAAHGLPQITSTEHYRSLFGFPIVDYYRRLGFDFSKTPYADLAVEWVAYYLEESRAATLYPDVIDALARVRAAGISQTVLSATELGMLTRQIEELGISHCFDGLLGLANIQAYSKQELGVMWRREHPDASALLVGDTDHDAEVAAAMGIDCALVCRGHQSRETLAALTSVGVFETLTEMLDRVL